MRTRAERGSWGECVRSTWEPRRHPLGAGGLCVAPGQNSQMQFSLLRTMFTSIWVQMRPQLRVFLWEND